MSRTQIDSSSGEGTQFPGVRLISQMRRPKVESHASQDRLLRPLALCGIAAPILFAILVTVGGSISEGYSHVTQTVSELGGIEAEHPLLQNINFFVVGVLFIALAFGLHRGIGGGRGSILGPVLIGVFAISSAIGNGLLPCDLSCKSESLTGSMHIVTGLGGFLAAIAGIFVISRRLKGDPHWHSFFRFSRIASMVTLASLLIWIGVGEAAELGSVRGVLQRVFIAVLFTWTEVMAIRLFFIPSRGNRDARNIKDGVGQAHVLAGEPHPGEPHQ